MKFPADVPRLHDGVVTLRAHHEGDVLPLLEQALDPVMVAWTTVPIPSSEQTSRDFATKIIPTAWENDEVWSFAVEAVDEHGHPRFCGTVELRNQGDARAEIAYGAHPWARGHGVMERACRLLLDWGFREKRLRTVIWWATAGNWASRRLAWRLGFSVDGTVRRWLPQRGDLLDAWVGSLVFSDPREPRSDWFDLPVIHGEKVLLRAHRDSDAARVQQACSDARTQKWLRDVPSPYTPDDARAYLETRKDQLATGSGLSWAIANAVSDELVGTISVFDLKPGHQAEVGYWTHPDARGRGVMSEACGLVVRHAFIPTEDGGLGLRRLTAVAGESNTASRRVIEVTGFVAVGRERLGTRLRDGSLVDTICYDQLAEEWSGARRE